MIRAILSVVTILVLISIAEPALAQMGRHRLPTDLRRMRNPSHRKPTQPARDLPGERPSRPSRGGVQFNWEGLAIELGTKAIQNRIKNRNQPDDSTMRPVTNKQSSPTSQKNRIGHGSVDRPLKRKGDLPEEDIAGNKVLKGNAIENDASVALPTVRITRH